MARIFISYSRKDGSPVADELADRLRAFDHQVFLDVHSLRAGTRWRSELRQRIAWADLMIVLVTPGSNNSEYVRGEVDQAEKLNRPILPIQIGGTPTPDHLRSEWQVIKLEGNNLDRVLLELEHSLRLLPSKSPLPGRFLMTVALLIVIIGLGVFLYTRNQPSPAMTLTPEVAASDGASDTLIVEEDFEDEVADGWALQWGEDFTIIDDGGGNHVWRSAARGEIFYEPSAEWRDYAVKLDYYVVDWDESDVGVTLALRRQQDPECSRYDFVLHESLLAVGAADANCTGFVFFADDREHPNTPGGWHGLYVEVKGTQLGWQFDGGEMRTYQDELYAVGGVSFLNHDNTEIWFDSLQIWLLE
jgi:hypothetical protein